MARGNPNPSPETRFKPGNTFGKRPRLRLSPRLRRILAEPPDAAGKDRDKGDALMRALVMRGLQGDIQAINTAFARCDDVNAIDELRALIREEAAKDAKADIPDPGPGPAESGPSGPGAVPNPPGRSD